MDEPMDVEGTRERDGEETRERETREVPAAYVWSKDFTIRKIKAVVMAAVLPLTAGAAAAQGAEKVGVRQAIEAALENNVAAKLARTEDDAARARVLRSAAALLPNVLGTASQSRVFHANLAAQGLTLGGIDPYIGPYDSFDARARLTQTLFDWSSIKRYQAAEAGRDLAARQESLAREQVAAAAALAFVEALRAQKAVAAAQADAALAHELLTLTEDEKKQGTTTGVDVVRAETRSSDADVALLRAQVAERNAFLRLKRVAGWPLSRELALDGDLESPSAPFPPLEDALTRAANLRAEIDVASARLRVDAALLGAAQGERAPSLVGTADYGLSGNLPDRGARSTGSIGAALSVPLFAGGAIRGRVEEARAEKRRSEELLEDVRAQVEEDVRLSYANLAEADDEVKAARKTAELAERELTMAQDQYKAGATDNIAVVTAQTELAKARDGYVAALAADRSARISLSAALGQAREIAFN